MKIILKKDVPNLGFAGDVVTVADGYGRNYLIPKGLAEEATSSNLARAEEYRKERKAREQAVVEEAKEMASEIEGISMQMKMKSGEKGKLFGSVTSGDIADFLNGKGFSVDKKKVELDENIKSLGTHRVPIKLHPEVTVELEVVVEEEEEE